MFSKATDSSAEYMSLQQTPPAYEPPEGPIADLEMGGHSQYPPTADSLPSSTATNFFHFKSKQPIRGDYRVDIGFPPPPAFTLPEGQAIQRTDENLLLETEGDRLRANVWIVDPNRVDLDDISQAGPSKGLRDLERIRMSFTSTRKPGSLYVQIYAPDTPRPHLSLSLAGGSTHRSVRLGIPRSFRGQLTLHSTNGRVRLSQGLTACSAPLGSGQSGTCTFFVGDRPRSNTWRTGSTGEGEPVDDANVSSERGEVLVRYNDEALIPSWSNLYDETRHMTIGFAAFFLLMLIFVLVVLGIIATSPETQPHPSEPSVSPISSPVT